MERMFIQPGEASLALLSLRGAGRWRRRPADDQGDRLVERPVGGETRKIGALRQAEHGVEQADALLAEGRAQLDAVLRLGVGQAGDVVVMLLLGAAAETAAEIRVERALLLHQFRLE